MHCKENMVKSGHTEKKNALICYTLLQLEIHPCIIANPWTIDIMYKIKLTFLKHSFESFDWFVDLMMIA